MTQKKFRQLIDLYIALVIASIAAAFFPAGYTQALSEALDNEPTPLLLENLGLLFSLVLPLGATAIVGMYGLFMFRRWGRTLSLISTVAGLVLYPFFGPSLSTGLESALYDAATLLWGAILALSYHSAVAVNFSANNARLAKPLALGFATMSITTSTSAFRASKMPATHQAIRTLREKPRKASCLHVMHSWQMKE